MNIKIRKKDKVVVISGRDRGKRGEVLKVFPRSAERGARALISKVNIVAMHQKPKQTEPGGIQRKEAPIDLSNVMLLCPKCDKPIRPKLDRLQTGEVVRVCRQCSEVIL